MDTHVPVTWLSHILTFYYICFILKNSLVKTPVLALSSPSLFVHVDLFLFYSFMLLWWSLERRRQIDLNNSP